MRGETHTHGDEGDGATALSKDAELRAIVAMLEFAALRAREVDSTTVGDKIDQLVAAIKSELGAER